MCVGGGGGGGGVRFKQASYGKHFNIHPKIFMLNLAIQQVHVCKEEPTQMTLWHTMITISVNLAQQSSQPTNMCRVLVDQSGSHLARRVHTLQLECINNKPEQFKKCIKSQA